MNNSFWSIKITPQPIILLLCRLLCWRTVKRPQISSQRILWPVTSHLESLYFDPSCGGGEPPAPHPFCATGTLCFPVLRQSSTFSRATRKRKVKVIHEPWNIKSLGIMITVTSWCFLRTWAGTTGEDEELPALACATFPALVRKCCHSYVAPYFPVSTTNILALSILSPAQVPYGIPLAPDYLGRISKREKECKKCPQPS